MESKLSPPYAPLYDGPKIETEMVANPFIRGPKRKSGGDNLPLWGAVSDKRTLFLHVFAPVQNRRNLRVFCALPEYM